MMQMQNFKNIESTKNKTAQTMKKTSKPPFSNGTEFMVWEEHNTSILL